MARDARISVITPCYNDGHFLAGCVRSVQEQTLAPFEHLVIDDGSTDPRTIETLSGDWPANVRVVHKPNGGLGSARNEAIRVAQGDYLFFLDVDDLVMPRCLARLKAGLDEHSRVAFVYPHLMEFGERSRVYPAPEFDPFLELFENRWNPSVMVRRSMLKPNYRFDETMTLGYEDWEFWLQLLEDGLVGRLVPEYLFAYRIRGDSMLRSRTMKAHEQLAHHIRGRHPSLFTTRAPLEQKRVQTPFLSLVFPTPTESVETGPSRRQRNGLPDDVREITGGQAAAGARNRSPVSTADLAAQTFGDWEIVEPGVSPRGQWIVRFHVGAAELSDHALETIVMAAIASPPRSAVAFEAGGRLEAVAIPARIAGSGLRVADLPDSPARWSCWREFWDCRWRVVHVGLRPVGAYAEPDARVESTSAMFPGEQVERKSYHPSFWWGRTNVWLHQEASEAGSSLLETFRGQVGGPFFGRPTESDEPRVLISARHLDPAALVDWERAARGAGCLVTSLLDVGVGPTDRASDAGVERIEFERIAAGHGPLVHHVRWLAWNRRPTCIAFTGQSTAANDLDELTAALPETRFVHLGPDFEPVAGSLAKRRVESARSPETLGRLLSGPPPIPAAANRWGGARADRLPWERWWRFEDVLATPLLLETLRRWRPDDQTRFVLVAAGQHTRRIARALEADGRSLGDIGCIGIADDNEGIHGSIVGGVPVHGIEAIAHERPDLAVISSNLSGPVIRRLVTRCAPLRAAGAAVATLYAIDRAEDPPAKIVFHPATGHDDGSRSSGVNVGRKL